MSINESENSYNAMKNALRQKMLDKSDKKISPISIENINQESNVVKTNKAKTNKDEPLSVILKPGQKGAFLYSRVSHIHNKEDRDHNESISLDHQDHAITSYCHKNNYVIVEKFVDASISGGSIEGRPGMKSLLNKLRKNIVVICSTVSRLSRNTEELLYINRRIQEAGAELVVLDMPISPSSIQGEMLLSMLGSFATMERKQNNLKISECMKNASREGKLIKSPKWGWSVVNKQYVENPEQQKVISFIKMLLEHDPDMLAGRITRELEENGFKNRKGKTIHVTTVQSIMREIKTPTMPLIMEKQKEAALEKEKLKNEKLTENKTI